MKVNNPTKIPEIIYNKQEWDKAKIILQINGYNQYFSGRDLNHYENFHYPFELIVDNHIQLGKCIRTRILRVDEN